MARYSDTVRDQNNAPVEGALIYVTLQSGGTPVLTTDDDQVITQPLVSDEYGGYYFNAPDDFYDISFYYRSRLVQENQGVPVGDPYAQFVGPPGPAGPTYLTLAEFKAAPISNQKQALKDPSITFGDFFWTPGNFTGQADDENIIKADSTALSVGAWVRQNADQVVDTARSSELAASSGSSLIGFQQSGAGAISRTAQDKARDYVSVLDYGAKGDGIRVKDGFMSSGSTTLTSATAGFTTADVGKKIAVTGAGVAGATLTGTIVTRVSATEITISATASTTVLGMTVAYGSDDTTAIQSALNAHTNIYFPCGDVAERRYMFTHLEKPARSRWFGDGPYRSILRQFADVDVSEPAVVLTEYLPLNIAEGAHCWDDIGIEVASDTAILVRSVSASFMRSLNFRMWNQIQEIHNQKPYPVKAGTIAFDLDSATLPAATIFISSHRNLELRAFETCIKAAGPVNEQQFHGWFLDCKVGFDLNSVSKWDIDVAFETGVDNARKYRFTTNVSNIRGNGRCEIPVAESSPGVPASSTDHYMSEFVGTVDAASVSLSDFPILITQDGGAWPGRKYKGTLPEGVLFDIPLFLNGALRQTVLGNSAHTLFYGLPLYLGGFNRGNGRITLGRNSDDGNISTIQNDGTNLRLDCPNGVMIEQTQGGQGYTKPLFIGAYAFWVDGSGLFRIKAGYPANDTDGTVVGTQT